MPGRTDKMYKATEALTSFVAEYQENQKSNLFNLCKFQGVAM